ncbi:MAG: SUMF1/EgtB/PvdO family nonheme iron enzyme [Bacteroidales bacterium]|nr:SUMF1/EgtB/PvdO family nonheme iron enzyme [Bacteroidales bacterium]
MKHITTHSFTFLIALLCFTFWGVTLFAQNTSPVYVVEFNKILGGIMDEEKIPKNQREDYDNNPVCLVKVKAQGFDEATLQKLIFVPRNIMIMHKAYENGEYRLYVSSRKSGSILIKYQGEYEFKLPYNLEPKKIYELVLGMETATLVIKTSPSDAVVYIDDEQVGVGYGSKAVSIGAEHRYKVESQYYYPKEDVVMFEVNEKKEIVVNLEPAFGFVTVKTTPSGADVYVDDKLVGRTPYLSEIIGLGMHKITVNKEGYETDVKRVNINLNKEETLEFELIEGESSMPVQQVVQQAVAQPVATQKPENGVVTDADGNMVATVNGVDFKMIKVEGGTFTMGASRKKKTGANYDKDAESDERPIHSVTLGEYYIGEFEVTQELWEAVMGSNPSHFKGGNLPVEMVSWNDCQGFIVKLNRLTGKTFRLPTEAQWEYAARGGSKSKGYKYSGSNSINDVAWYTDNSGSKTHTVGTKSPNELGIYDMSGNVCEWCQDWYGSYSSGSQTNPTGPSSGSCRVFRGGGWVSGARLCRVSSRYAFTPFSRYYYFGFRLVLVP